MMDCWTEACQPLLEGNIKYRDSKQWKSRWAIITKPSPIADCLKVLMFKNFKEKIQKNLAPKTTIELEHYLGMESGFTFDKESNTMAIICVKQTIVMAFETREILLQWQSRLHEHFCKEAHFLVHVMSVVPKNNKTLCGPHRLLLQDWNFCLVSGIPPRLSFHWPIKQLRRFGIIEGKFCFEGGSQCGKGAGLHILYTSQPEQLARYFELASNGQLNSLITNGNQDSQDEQSARNRLAHQQRQRSINSGSDSGDSSCQLLSSMNDVLDSVSNYCLDSVDCHYHSSINLNQKSFDGRLGNKCSYSSNTISRFSGFPAEKANLADHHHHHHHDCQKIDKNQWKMVKNHPRGIQLNFQSRERGDQVETCESTLCDNVVLNGTKVVQNNNYQDESNVVDIQGSGGKDSISKKAVIEQRLNDSIKNYDIPRNVCLGGLNGIHGANQKPLDGGMKNEGSVNDCICQQIELYNIMKSDLDHVDSQVCGCNNISSPECDALDQEFIGSSAIETMAQEWLTCDRCEPQRNYGFDATSQSDKSNPEANRREQLTGENFGYENMYFLNTMQLYENMCFFRKNHNDIHTKDAKPIDKMEREQAFSKVALQDSADGTSLSLSKDEDGRIVKEEEEKEEEEEESAGLTTNNEMGVEENGGTKQNGTMNNNETGDIGRNPNQVLSDQHVEDGDNAQERTTVSFEKLEISNFQAEAEAKAEAIFFSQVD